MPVHPHICTRMHIYYFEFPFRQICTNAFFLHMIELISLLLLPPLLDGVFSFPCMILVNLIDCYHGCNCRVKNSALGKATKFGEWLSATIIVNLRSEGYLYHGWISCKCRSGLDVTCCKTQAKGVVMRLQGVTYTMWYLMCSWVNRECLWAARGSSWKL